MGDGTWGVPNSLLRGCFRIDPLCPKWERQGKTLVPGHAIGYAILNDRTGNRIVRQARTFPDGVSILKIITDDLAGRIAIPGIRSGCSGDYLSCSFMLNDCRRCPTVPSVSVFHPNGFSIFCIQNLDGRLSAIVPKNNQFVLMQNG